MLAPSERSDSAVADARKRRLPTCRTRPSSSSAGTSRSSVRHLAVEPHAALLEQPARLRARAPERLGDQRPAGGPASAGRTASSAHVLGHLVARRRSGRSAPRRPRAASAPWKRVHERPRERALGVARRRRPRAPARPSSSANHAAIASSGSDIVLPNISSGGSVTPTWLPSDLDIFSAPSMPGQDRHRQDRLLGLAVGALDVAAEQQVEGLVGAAELDVGLDRPPSRSPAAADRAARAPRSARARAKRLAKSSRSRIWATVATRARRKRSSAGMSSHSPLRRTSSSSGSSTQHLAGLLAVGRALRVDLLAREHGPRRGAPAGVPHARGVVADDQHDLVAEVLELAQLAAARPCGRGGCRAPSGPSRASRAAGGPPARRPRACAPGRPPAGDSCALRSRWRAVSAAEGIGRRW